MAELYCNNLVESKDHKLNFSSINIATTSHHCWQDFGLGDIISGHPDRIKVSIQQRAVAGL